MKDANIKDISINNIRYSIYCEKAGKVVCDPLPPYWNALKQHIRRLNCQTKLWRLCLEAMINKVPREDHSCFITNGKLDIQ